MWFVRLLNDACDDDSLPSGFTLDNQQVGASYLKGTF